MTRITPPPGVTDKFRELVLYIAGKSADDPRFGAVKLNKILYYSDFAAYRLLGHPITGDDYQNLAEGPAPLHLLTARDSLLADGSALLETKPYFNRKQIRIKAHRQPKPGVLAQDELGIVDQVIEALWEYDAQQVSALSHAEFGWRLTRRNEPIPYYTAWVSPEPLTVDQVQRGFEVAERHGLTAPTGS